MDKDTNQSTGEKSNNTLLKILLFSILLGTAAAFLANSYITKRINALSEGSLQSIVIADTTINQGSVITQEMLSKKDLPSKFIHFKAVKTSEALSIVGQRAANSIPAGEPVLFNDILLAKDTSLAERLIPGYRAMTISLASAASVNGFIKPGDRVDVQYTSSGNSGVNTKTLLQNITVIAVGDHMVNTGESSGSSASSSGLGGASNAITLNLTPEQASMLTLAQSAGQVTLLLRNVNDIVIRNNVSADVNELMKGSESIGPQQPAGFPSVFKGSTQVPNLYLPENLMQIQQLRNAIETQGSNE